MPCPMLAGETGTESHGQLGNGEALDEDLGDPAHATNCGSRCADQNSDCREPVSGRARAVRFKHLR
jgi:hypothetical protein